MSDDDEFKASDSGNEDPNAMITTSASSSYPVRRSLSASKPPPSISEIREVLAYLNPETTSTTIPPSDLIEALHCLGFHVSEDQLASLALSPDVELTADDVASIIEHITSATPSEESELLVEDAFAMLADEAGMVTSERLRHVLLACGCDEAEVAMTMAELDLSDADTSLDLPELKRLLLHQLRV